MLDEFYNLKYTIFMNKLLKIFCFCGLFCLWNCCKNSIHPNLINKKVCKQILLKNYFDDNEYIINDDISIQELYELLQNATLCDIIKLPPRLVLTIKGTNYHQTFFICDDYIKDDKRKIYRCRKNIEKELKKIIKDNRSHNGLERSEWQAVYGTEDAEAGFEEIYRKLPDERKQEYAVRKQQFMDQAELKQE